MSRDRSSPACRRIGFLWLATLASAALPLASAVGQSNLAKIPPPVDVSLTTKDGVQLKATYYGSSAGREAVPVIMLHDFNETRAVFDPLARALQDPPESDNPSAPKILPRAILTVDLRGHGQSKTAVGRDGGTVELDANRFQQLDFQAMVLLDMEAVRAFLVEQNDAGRLNLNKLGIVGSGMGANVALLWAAKDWATPPLAVRKQGQDVKALVLLSPRWNFHGLMLRDAMKFPPIREQLSIMMAYGADDPAVTKDCENIRKIFARYHPEPPADQVQQRKDFFVYARETNLQGTKLLTSRAFGLGTKIVSFLEARLGSRSFAYSVRKNP